MLEKIGLPAKPSLRGNTWVVDASHCQGCSSQFTFINRKHHCRRCGGIFCNSCTQQRMMLRGQGDSPVRICEPCKKLEEAARFELRQGYKNRAGKGGSSKLLAKQEDEVLSQILGADGKESSSSGLASKNLSADDLQNETTSTDPEDMRQRALDEKKKYKTLKGEGKHEEALRAFKRGKELERQAGALEISIRKNRKRVLTSGSTAAEIPSEDDPKESSRNSKLPRPAGKDKDDLASELRELGWSDMDLHDDDKKAAGVSLEGELSSLLGEVSRKTSTHAIDKSEVVAIKKKALILKREGDLAGAKEELKRAKILEKKLEEQEILGGDEDSDDELSALIRSMDDDKQDKMAMKQSENFEFDHFVGNIDGLDLDGNLEVTEDDMEDPEMYNALKSFGWAEDSNPPESILPRSTSAGREALLSEILSLKKEALSQKRAGNASQAMVLLKKAKLLEKDLENLDNQTDGPTPQIADEENISFMGDLDLKPAPRSRLAIQKELLALKKKALTLRREGRVDEAEEELKKGQVLERQLEEMDNAPSKKTKQVTSGSKKLDFVHEPLNMSEDLPERGGEDVTDQDLHDPTYLSILSNLGWNEEEEKVSVNSAQQSKQRDTESSMTETKPNIPRKASKRTKAEIQRELLGLKRKALSLRRQGNTDEADEVLEKAKELEAEIEEMEAPKKLVESDGPKGKIVEPVLTDAVGGDAEDVTENDMNNPALVSVLKNLGWKDEEPLPVHEEPSVETVISHSSSAIAAAAPRSKGEIQRELLGLKRKALALKRSGESEEAEEVLKMAKILEAQMVEPENPTSDEDPLRKDAASTGESEVVNSAQNSQVMPAKPVQEFSSPEKQDSVKQEVLLHKRKALAFKREGKLAEAREELRQAKLLEKSQAEEDSPPQTVTNEMSVSAPSVRPNTEDPGASSSVPKKLSGRDRFKLQQESLSHKRQAMKLRREGRTQEAEAEFELAKALEAQLDEANANDSSSGPEGVDDVVVETLFDPQLMSALKEIGLDSGSVMSQSPEKPAPPAPVKDSAPKTENASQERVQLEERIKAEKIKAVNLKRSGKQAEALDALRRAKLFEKKLSSLTS